MAFGARLRGVDHPPGGFHPRPGEAVGTLLSRLLLLLRRLLAPGGRFMPRHPGPSPPPDSRGSRLSTRWRSSAIAPCCPVMTPCCSAITAIRVSRLARSSPVSIVPLCHNSAPVASAFQPGGGLRQIRLTKSEQLLRENCETPWLRLLPLLGDEYRQNISEVHLLSLADESYPRHFYSASSETKEFRNFLLLPHFCVKSRLSDSISRVLLAWGRFCVTKAIIPDGPEHFFTPSAHRDTHLSGGLGPRSAGLQRNQHPRRRPRFIGLPMPVHADTAGRGQACCSVHLFSNVPRPFRAASCTAASGPGSVA